MGNFLEKLTNIIPANNGGGDIIPTNVQNNLRNLGEKGGQKYSNLVDKLVDTILKK